ncbi:MAG: DUF308 domain-containing protein [Candidatus Pacebacteria bacterium]|nr:DUF308 domain-containing protein [Candidatus Paceibacterota bacterium]
MKNNLGENFVISIADNYVKQISSNWWDIFVTGALLFIFGAIFVIWPQQSITFIAYLIGVMAIVIGIVIMYNSFKVKNIEKNYMKMKENIKNKFFE